MVKLLNVSLSNKLSDLSLLTINPSDSGTNNSGPASPTIYSFFAFTSPPNSLLLGLLFSVCISVKFVWADSPSTIGPISIPNIFAALDLTENPKIFSGKKDNTLTKILSLIFLKNVPKLKLPPLSVASSFSLNKKSLNGFMNGIANAILVNPPLKLPPITSPTPPKNSNKFLIGKLFIILSFTLPKKSPILNPEPAGLTSSGLPAFTSKNAFNTSKPILKPVPKPGNKVAIPEARSIKPLPS